MKGLFLNVPRAAHHIENLSKLLGVDSYVAHSTPSPDTSLHISYAPDDWPQGPVFSDPSSDLFAAGSGWFFYKGKPGNLEEFAREFSAAHSRGEAKQVAAGIEAGAYILFLRFSGKNILVTDPFGLHPHYFVSGGSPLQLAPAPALLDHSAPQEPVLLSILGKQDHLYGNYTSYDGILRLEPGVVIEGHREEPYFSYEPQHFRGEDLRHRLTRVNGNFSARRRILPLSGGLDSRLLLAFGQFDFGYTYGPVNTGDRPVARRFKSLFKDYDEFSLLDLSYPSRYKEAGKTIFEGCCARPFNELFAVYGRVSGRFGRDCVFFDGYAGDVLQSGTFLTYGGWSGHLSKLFPALTTKRFDPLRLLRGRYRALNAMEFDRVAGEYEKKTKSWNLDPARKLMLFEILYGKGSRHALNGGTTMSFQYFTPVQPYYVPGVFRILFGLDPFESVSYGSLKRIWEGVPEAYASVLTYAGFKPTWKPWVSRVARLVSKGLARLGVNKQPVSYEAELERVEWEGM